MSLDGDMMASGDRSGNLRVHDMNTWELLTYQEAHDSEILSIDLTTPKDKGKSNLESLFYAVILTFFSFRCT